MSSELETSESVDVSSEGASTPQPESQSSSETPEVKSSEPSAPAFDASKYVPYDRFQEVIQTKNELTKRLEEQEKRFSEFENRYKQQSNPQLSEEQALLKQIREVNPAFAKVMEEQISAKKQLEELTRQYQQDSTARSNLEVENALERLHTENKVSAEAKDLYRSMLVDMARNNPKLGLQDLPNLYKQVHDKVGKFLDSYKRSALAEYSQEKKAATSVPASQKGQSSKASKDKFEYSKDPEEAKRQIVKRALEEKRTNENSS